MEKYCETQRKPIVNWCRILDTKEENLNRADLKDYYFLAGSWVTCACGNQCSVIPRSAEGAPKDDILYTLGIQFYQHFSTALRDYDEGDIKSVMNELQQAKVTLAKIEKRSSLLIPQYT